MCVWTHGDKEGEGKETGNQKGAAWSEKETHVRVVLDGRNPMLPKKLEGLMWKCFSRNLPSKPSGVCFFAMKQHKLLVSLHFNNKRYTHY